MSLTLQALAAEGRDPPSQQLDLETAWANGFMPGLSEEEEGLLPPGSDERLYTEVIALLHAGRSAAIHTATPGTGCQYLTSINHKRQFVPTV